MKEGEPKTLIKFGNQYYAQLMIIETVDDWARSAGLLQTKTAIRRVSVKAIVIVSHCFVIQIKSVVCPRYLRANMDAHSTPD